MAEDKNININVTANVNEGNSSKSGGGIPSIQSINSQRSTKATLSVMQAAQKQSDVNKPSDTKSTTQAADNTEVTHNLKNILATLTKFVDDQRISAKAQTDAIANLSNEVKSLASTEKTGMYEGPSQIVISDFSIEALQKYKSTMSSSLSESLSSINSTLVTNMSSELSSYVETSGSSNALSAEDINTFKESVNLFKTSLDYSIQSKNGEISSSEAADRAKSINEYLKELSEASPNLLQATKDLASKMEEGIDFGKLAESTGDAETTAFNRSLLEELASRQKDETSKAIEQGVSQILNSKQVTQMSDELYTYIEDSIKSRQITISAQNDLAEKIQTSVIRNVNESAREQDISLNTSKIEEAIIKDAGKSITVNNANSLGNGNVLDKNRDKAGLMVSQNNLIGETTSMSVDSLKKSNEKPLGELSTGGNYVLKSSANLSGKSTNANLIDAMSSMKSTMAKDQMTPMSNLMEKEYVQNGKSLNTLYEILGVFKAFSKNYAQIAQDARDRQNYLDSFTVEKEEKKSDTIINLKPGDSKKTTEKKNEEEGILGLLGGLISSLFLGGKSLKGFLWGTLKGVFKWVGKGLWTATKWVFKGAVKVFKWLGKGLWKGIKWVSKWIGKGLGKLWGFLKGGISKIFGGIGKFFSKLMPNCLKNLGGIFKNMFGKISGMISKAAKGLGKGIKTLGKGLGSLVKGATRGAKVITKGAGGIIKGVSKVLTKGAGGLLKGGGKLIASGAGKLLAKGGLKAAARLGAGALKAIPGVGLIATAGMAAFDAVQGWKNAAEISGKRPEDVTTGDKVKAAGASVLSGLTFGLVSSKSMYKGISAVTGGVSKVAKGLWSGAKGLGKGLWSGVKTLAKFHPLGLLASGAKKLFEGDSASTKEMKLLTKSITKLRAILVVLAKKLLGYTGAGLSLESGEMHSKSPWWAKGAKLQPEEQKKEIKKSSIDFLQSLDENVIKLVESVEAIMSHFQIKPIQKVKLTTSKTETDNSISISQPQSNVSNDSQAPVTNIITTENATSGVRNTSNVMVGNATSMASNQIRLQQLKTIVGSEGELRMQDIASTISPSEISQGVLKGMADYFSTYTPTVHTDTQTTLKYNIYSNDSITPAVLRK